MRKKLERCRELLPESKGQDLVLIVSHLNKVMARKPGSQAYGTANIISQKLFIKSFCKKVNSYTNPSTYSVHY
jgi:hypothetical protein